MPEAAAPDTTAAELEQRLPEAARSTNEASTSGRAADVVQPGPAAGFTRTFYKRELPSPPATAFSSREGKQLFAEALQQGTMEGFFKLIEQFRTQDEPAFCGLASLAMVLNTLEIDPRRPWKGPWRWFHEAMLDCCAPLARVAEEGISLQQAACLARCNGARVEVRQQGGFTLEQFREDVQRAAASEREHIIVSYSRRRFAQTGDGHYSPVGGYHADRDLVLILDTARFKYPPHWLPLPHLFEAMAALDPTTGHSRGYLKMGALPRLDSVLFTLERRIQGWQAAPGFWAAGLPEALAALDTDACSGAAAVAAAAAAAPLAPVLAFMGVRAESSCASNPGSGTCTQPEIASALLRELRGMALHAAVEQGLRAAAAARRQPCGSCCGGGAAEGGQLGGQLSAERMTAFLLLAPREAWGALRSSTAREVERLLSVLASSIMATELQFLQNQRRELPALDEFDSQNAACLACTCSA